MSHFEKKHTFKQRKMLGENAWSYCRTFCLLAKLNQILNDKIINSRLLPIFHRRIPNFCTLKFLINHVLRLLLFLYYWSRHKGVDLRPGIIVGKNLHTPTDDFQPSNPEINKHKSML